MEMICLTHFQPVRDDRRASQKFADAAALTGSNGFALARKDQHGIPANGRHRPAKPAPDATKARAMCAGGRFAWAG